ncbi:hypothetical protein ACFVT2_22015 [Streptomyces sp. NPDC058000]|uniref:hypothetical protein n=1 Tax=Streptomyces sp. NPDC058000 TaxID=3346299 RepID=UPI0036E3AF23
MSPRQVGLRIWHFRGIGAHGVLRVAAEQGRQLDHPCPVDPHGEPHLCRLADPSGAIDRILARPPVSPTAGTR